MRNYKEIKRPYSVAFFHGEDWYKCPDCNRNFEFYDVIYGRYGFKEIDKDKRIYQCKCGCLLDMR